MDNELSNITPEHRENIKNNPAMWWYRDSNGIKNCKCEKSRLISDYLWNLSERMTCMPFGVFDLEIDISVENLLKNGLVIPGSNVRVLDIGLQINECHINAMCLKNSAPDLIEHWRGFYFSGGLWREHSWCRDVENDIHIEITSDQPAELYFGVKVID